MALWFSLLLLLGNAFFVGAEFSVMAARRSQMEPLAAEGSRRAKLVLEALENVASLLACAQLGITVCSVLLGAVAEDALHHLLVGPFHAVGLPEEAAEIVALLLALLIVVYLHVVVGEMIPKNLAIAGPDRAALLLAPVLLWITKALRPLIRLLEAIAKWLVRRFGIEPKDEVASTFSAEEVHMIMEESHREGLLEKEQQDRTRAALEFSDRVAGDVAVPLDGLVTLPIGASPADLEQLVAKRGFSRYPVTDRNGAIAGYLHLKDVLYATDELYEDPVPPKRIRPLATVRTADEVEDVLLTMQRTGSHLARAVDAEGAVVGVVFLEDLLEELVGEVADQTQR
ncbi:hemolysin family protein [Luteipulveratus sp. YIM 133132]|uniref:Hemolysin family protein n=1 Tax=Luteipulveratus flavus TaxID=3031728 RepID=A0ABT6C836_9MICO|nr:MULTISPECIES: hemolysin family protein [unclassified Luteipulveratus]MDE9365908.1 hemolysin family protein [Luteipulveratus sp. YIM 133132]MDF8265098.1 hemolysin family protein [Luteipulveratus sp. YIM 133296]